MTAALVVLGMPATTDAATATDTAEVGMIAAINEVRARHGLDALRRSSSLMGSARRFSRQLMEQDTFGHAASIQASGEFVQLGEALEMHTGLRFRVRKALQLWMASASHRAIVLTRTMRWLGTGVTRGRFGASPATIWVLQTGRIEPVDTPSLPTVPLP